MSAFCPPGTTAQVLPDFTELASRVKPAVVTILSDLNPGAAADDGSGSDQGDAQGDNGSGDGGPGDNGPQAQNGPQNGLPFALPFPFNMMPGAPGMMAPQRPQAIEAAGSGFIINSNGTIVTEQPRGAGCEDHYRDPVGRHAPAGEADRP